MHSPVSDLRLMIAGMQPVLNDGVYVYTCVPHGTDTADFAPIATMREIEGITLVISEQQAQAFALPVLYRCAWITLNVHSDLNACGLTAAFGKALADEGISCNVVAGAYHDHLFVPIALADQAMSALMRLQNAQIE